MFVSKTIKVRLSKNNYMMSKLGYLTSSNGSYGNAETFDNKS